MPLTKPVEITLLDVLSQKLIDNRLTILESQEVEDWMKKRNNHGNCEEVRISFQEYPL